MNVHANARLSPLGRLLMCERVRLEGWTVAEAAEAANMSERRAPRPPTSPARTPATVEAAIV